MISSNQLYKPDLVISSLDWICYDLFKKDLSAIIELVCDNNQVNLFLN